MRKAFKLLFSLMVTLPGIALASTESGNYLDLTQHWVGYASLVIALGYGASIITHMYLNSSSF